MIEVKNNTPLSQYSFYGIGGPVDELFFIDDAKEFADVWGETISTNIPHIILGGGSNIAFADKGFRGRVFIPKFEKTKLTTYDDTTFLKVEAGKNLQNLIEESAKEGFTDLTNLAGIPGTLGGAVRGNAGAYGSEISEFIVEIEYVNELGNIEKISPQKAEFDYRTSIFKQNPDWAITSATLKLTQKENPETALEKIKNLTKERWQKIPAGKSGGSFFKNPTNNSAGKLLDELGAKGDQLGEIQIAQNHANFFLNTGNGKQNDLIELARKWKHKVSEKHNISLEPEVILVDEFGEIVKL